MTKEEKQSPKEPAWAYVAIDWADRKRVWQLHVAEGDSHERGELEQTPEAIEIWASQLAMRFGDVPLRWLSSSRAERWYSR